MSAAAAALPAAIIPARRRRLRRRRGQKDATVLTVEESSRLISVGRRPVGRGDRRRRSPASGARDAPVFSAHRVVSAPSRPIPDAAHSLDESRALGCPALARRTQAKEESQLLFISGVPTLSFLEILRLSRRGSRDACLDFLSEVFPPVRSSRRGSGWPSHRTFPSTHVAGEAREFLRR